MPALPLVLAASLSAASLAYFALDATGDDPEVRIEDAYKWLFQAASGGEHAVPDEESARRWLEREWRSLGPSSRGEPLLVSLRSDGALVRLNLRPYRDRCGTPGALLEAFLRSARAFEPDQALFRETWAALGELVAAHPAGRLNGAEWSRLDASMRVKGYPALHHSSSYAAARHPAYRVLTRGEADRLVQTLGPEGTCGGPGPPR